jgi:hypothetical protein
MAGGDLRLVSTTPGKTIDANSRVEGDYRYEKAIGTRKVYVTLEGKEALARLQVDSFTVEQDKPSLWDKIKNPSLFLTPPRATAEDPATIGNVEVIEARNKPLVATRNIETWNLEFNSAPASWKTGWEIQAGETVSIVGSTRKMRLLYYEVEVERGGSSNPARCLIRDNDARHLIGKP